MPEVENVPGLGILVRNRARRSGLNKAGAQRKESRRTKGQDCFPPSFIPELQAIKAHTVLPPQLGQQPQLQPGAFGACAGLLPLQGTRVEMDCGGIFSKEHKSMWEGS